MRKVCLIHWKAEEAPERLARLRAAGFDPFHAEISGPEAFRTIRDAKPAAVVIDLDRLPSHGRETALHLRRQKPTRQVPIVFVGGADEKVARIRTLMPDAAYTTWPRVNSTLTRALRSTPKNPLVPHDGMAGYSGTPLPKKLGIKPKHIVALISAPQDFAQTLGELPDDVSLIASASAKRDLGIWFVRSQKDLRRGLRRQRKLAERGPLWIAWPKKASGVVTDLSEQFIRDSGLSIGLVDYKICAIDPTWSGLLFAVRKSQN